MRSRLLGLRIADCRLGTARATPSSPIRNPGTGGESEGPCHDPHAVRANFFNPQSAIVNSQSEARHHPPPSYRASASACRRWPPRLSDRQPRLATRHRHTRPNVTNGGICGFQSRPCLPSGTGFEFADPDAVFGGGRLRVAVAAEVAFGGEKITVRELFVLIGV